jgi:hypothetical protein
LAEFHVRQEQIAFGLVSASKQFFESAVHE